MQVVNSDDTSLYTIRENLNKNSCRYRNRIRYRVECKYEYG